MPNNDVISSQGKLVNKSLRYAILVGWFFSLFVAVTTTGLFTYFKVIKGKLNAPVITSTPIISPTPATTPEPATLLAEAKTDLQTGNTQLALDKLVEAIKLDPNNTEIYKIYAEALVAANRYQEAIENYQKAIDLNKEDVDSRQKLGQAAEQIGQDDKAINIYI